MDFNKKLSRIDFSGISKIVKKANLIEGDLIRLEIGDVEFNPPAAILNGIMNAFAENKTHYPAFQGNANLINEIINFLKKRELLQIDPSQILITAGGSMALYLSLQTILNDGDEVIIPTPVWPHLREMVILAGGQPVEVALNPENDFHLEMNQIQNAISSKTKAVLINTPNNPTGTIYNENEIISLCQIAQTNDLTIISDEEYDLFCFNSSYINTPIRFYPKSIITRSFSKSFAVSGLRLGYLVAPADWIPQLSKWNLYSSMYNSSIVQEAVYTALLMETDFMLSMMETYKIRMYRIVKRLHDMPGVECKLSEGAIYVWPDFRRISKNDTALADYLLEKGKVVTIPGSIFGETGRGFLRISLANSDAKLDEAMNRIENCLTTFKND